MIFMNKWQLNEANTENFSHVDMSMFQDIDTSTFQDIDTDNLYTADEMFREILLRY